MDNQFVRAIIIGLVVGLGCALIFMAGFFANDILESSTGTVTLFTGTQSESYPLLDEVQSLVNQIYLRQQPDYTVRQYGAIRGMLASLGDNNTFFIEPPVARSESDVLAGTYGGVGALLSRNEQGAFVMYPYPDSPATAAGILDGTLLLAINGVELLPTDQPDAVDQRLRGEVVDGNGVELTIQDASGERVIFVPFGVVNVPSVFARLIENDNRIAYIQILRFTSRTPEELRGVINQIEGVSAYILDLRNNGGGLLEESIAVASEFLNGGTIVYEMRKDSEIEYPALTTGLLTDDNIPLVVLVNNHTASAAELVAGAIQDRGRGILIGQHTYGKGTVQQIFSLSDGSSVHITSAEWLTPSRHSLVFGEGLTPNIAMIPDENGRDVELGESIRYLQQQLDGK